MSQSTQSKFFALLRARVAPLGYQIVDNREYANTGIFQIENPDSMKPAVSIRYSFQSGYATFSSTNERATLGARGSYVKNAELDAFLDLVLEFLPAVKTARKSRQIEASDVQVAFVELIEQAAREDDGNFFANCAAANYAGVTRLTMPDGQVFTIIAHRAEGK